MTNIEINHPSGRLELLRWAARIGAVTAEALAARERLSVGSARARLLAAERAGMLSRWSSLRGAPALYTLTRAGLRASGLRGLELPRVSPANARHSIVCAEVAAAIELAYPGRLLTGEQRLRLLEREEGRALASARIRGVQGALGVHRPDLVLWPSPSERSRPVAIEVELTVKAPRRLIEICRGWARCRCVAGVLYAAAPEVLRPLERAVEGAGASAQVLVLPIEAVLASGAEVRAAAISRAVPGDA